MGFKIARIVAIFMLFLAAPDLQQPYSYYTLLRFVVCGVTAYGAYFAAEILDRIGWTIILGSIAVLFNPIKPIHLDKNTWGVIDVAVAVILIVSFFSLRRKGAAEDTDPGSEEQL